MSTLINFENLNNTRDLGGMKTRDGRVIRSGRLIRSGQLYFASEKDREMLTGLVGLIIDFRSDQEIHSKPDPFPGNDPASPLYMPLPILNAVTPGITKTEEAESRALEALMRDPDGAASYMIQTYRAFAADTYIISRFEQFIRLLLKERDKAVLWHCTAGKDRSGFAAIIIQEILGVDPGEILEDYLATNVFLRREVDNLIQMIAGLRNQLSENAPSSQLSQDDSAAGSESSQPSQSDSAAGSESSLSAPSREALDALFTVREEYFLALYDEISLRFGNFDGFLRKGLHLSEEELARFRELYLL